MSSPTRSPVAAFLQRLLPGMKFPALFVILAGLLGLDLVFPDPVPFIDEAVLAILTLLVGSWRSRREPDLPPRDVTPPKGKPQLDVDEVGGEAPQDDT